MSKFTEEKGEKIDELLNNVDSSGLHISEDSRIYLKDEFCLLLVEAQKEGIRKAIEDIEKVKCRCECHKKGMLYCSKCYNGCSGFHVERLQKLLEEGWDELEYGRKVGASYEDFVTVVKKINEMIEVLNQLSQQQEREE